MQTAEEFVKMMVQGIVRNPDKVSVKETIDEEGTFLSIRVTKEDMGLVVGKRGLCINAIKSIVRAFGFRSETQINIKLEEPEEDGKNN